MIINNNYENLGYIIHNLIGTTYTGYAKVVSKPMEKCLKDMRKT